MKGENESILRNSIDDEQLQKWVVIAEELMESQGTTPQVKKYWKKKLDEHYKKNGEKFTKLVLKFSDMEIKEREKSKTIIKPILGLIDGEKKLMRCATIADSEGCFGIYYRTDYEAHFTRFVTNMVHPAFIFYLKKVLGCGTVRHEKKMRSKHSKHRQWVYVANCVKALRVALLLYKYLIIKKEKAKSIILLYKERVKTNLNLTRTHLSRYGIVWNGKNFCVDGEEIDVNDVRCYLIPSFPLLATLIDCEGWVGFGKHGKVLAPSVTVEMTDKKYIEKFKDLTPYRTYNIYNRKKYGQKNGYKISFTHLNALRILLLIKDYLVINKSKAKSIIEWYKKQLKKSKSSLMKARKKGIIFDGKEISLCNECTPKKRCQSCSKWIETNKYSNAEFYKKNRKKYNEYYREWRKKNREKTKLALSFRKLHITVPKSL